MHTADCIVCGKQFTSKRETQRFCSKQCFYAHRIEDHKKTCPACGERFTPERTEQIFCSRQCSATTKRGVSKNPLLKLCPVCGKEFGGKRSRFENQQYCSMRCYSISTKESRSCPTCGKTFYVDQSDEKVYCSRACAFAANDTRVTTECETCGKLFTQTKSREQRFCSRKCADRREIPKRRKLVRFVCQWCGTSFEKYPSTKAQFCSRECQAAHHSANRRGETHHLYKGGKTKFRGRNWGHQSRLALERDGYRCQVCSKRIMRRKWDYGVHHIKPYREFNGDYLRANELSNLVSLCRSCHQKVEAGSVSCPRPLF